VHSEQKNRHLYTKREISALYKRTNSKREPMHHFTPLAFSPSEKQLIFLRAFARLYTPQPDNEPEARRLARLVAEGKLAAG